MTRTIEIRMYTIEEACERLANKRGRKKPYSRPRFYKLVEQYKPEIVRARFSEPEIDFLAECIRSPGRPRKTIDKKE